jgi:hypothetical protein
VFDGAWLENEKAPLPGPFSVERTGIEPVTSGLQSRGRVSDVSPRSFEKPLVMQVCGSPRKVAPHT